MQTLNELIRDINFKIQEKKIDNALDLLSSFNKYRGEDWQTHYESERDEFQSAILHKDDNFKLVLM